MAHGGDPGCCHRLPGGAEPWLLDWTLLQDISGRPASAVPQGALQTRLCPTLLPSCAAVLVIHTDPALLTPSLVDLHLIHSNLKIFSWSKNSMSKDSMLRPLSEPQPTQGVNPKMSRV